MQVNRENFHTLAVPYKLALGLIWKPLRVHAAITSNSTPTREKKLSQTEAHRAWHDEASSNT